MISKDKKQPQKSIEQDEPRELIHIDDYLMHYSTLDPILKTSFRMRVESITFRSLEAWKEEENKILGGM